ncbi:hypothetical protein DFH29DRAFT_954234 [Suillus ampliporus]|nr:hypothetical protein DFH29DRAFT_954234 [Suillus ampliporus]
MAAACFPEEQAIVQAELDAVIGRHQAHNIHTAGMRHRTTKDVIWGNYCIPAGDYSNREHW